MHRYSSARTHLEHACNLQKPALASHIVWSLVRIIGHGKEEGGCHCVTVQEGSEQLPDKRG